MVNKCSAFGCKSGYASIDKEEKKGISFHSFPLNNPDLCEKWIKANARCDLVPNKSSRMCSIHFLPTDFVTAVSFDTNKYRFKKRSESNKPVRLRKKLRDGAVPSIFPDAPSYFLIPKQVTLTSKPSSSDGREFQQQQMEELEVSFAEDDVISKYKLSELEEHLKTETTMPSGYHLLYLEFHEKAQKRHVDKRLNSQVQKNSHDFSLSHQLVPLDLSKRKRKASESINPSSLSDKPELPLPIHQETCRVVDGVILIEPVEEGVIDLSTTEEFVA